MKRDFGKRAALLALAFDTVLSNASVTHDVSESYRQSFAPAYAAFLQRGAERGAGVVARELEQMVFQIRVNRRGDGFARLALLISDDTARQVHVFPSEIYHVH